jgi:hypothetical protein
MRSSDKLRNIEQANILAEQRYLASKGLLKEFEERDQTDRNDWPEIIKKNLTTSDMFSFDFNGKRYTPRVLKVHNVRFDNIGLLFVDLETEENGIMNPKVTIMVGRNPSEVHVTGVKGNVGVIELSWNLKVWLSVIKGHMLDQKKNAANTPR